MVEELEALLEPPSDEKDLMFVFWLPGLKLSVGGERYCTVQLDGWIDEGEAIVGGRRNLA